MDLDSAACRARGVACRPTHTSRSNSLGGDLAWSVRACRVRGARSACASTNSAASPPCHRIAGAVRARPRYRWGRPCRRRCPDSGRLEVVDPTVASSSLAAYQDYIPARKPSSRLQRRCSQDSQRWISDRSVCYLASGRPVVVQDTGEREFIGDLDGVAIFDWPDEAAAQVREVTDRYAARSRAAETPQKGFLIRPRLAGPPPRPGSRSPACLLVRH